MKEFTEIKLIDSDQNADSVLAIGDWVCFIVKKEDGIEEKILYGFSAGYPKSKIDDKTVKFSTQGFNENIPFTSTQSGKEVELFSNYKREKKIANGIIINRYFEKVTKYDWNIKEEINISDCTIQNINISLSEQEKTYLEYGNKPIQMEDKWFYFMENNILRIFRSWTGIELFQTHLLPNENNQWKINKLYLSNNPEYEFFSNTLVFENLIKSRIHRCNKIINV